MNKLFRFLMISACIFLSLFAAQTNAQTAKGKSSNAKTSQPDAAAAARKLRDYYFNRDYQGGYETGQNLRVRYPDNLELEAWYLANMARVPGKSADALELAKKLVAEKGETSWTLIALVQTVINNLKRDELLPTAEKLIKLAPNDEEAIFTYNSALYVTKKYAESIAFLDKNSSIVKDRSRLLTARANSFYQIAATKDAAKVKDALADFAKAVELDPNSVNANYIYASYLSLQKRPDEALPFLRKAVSLSPASLQVRELFWKTLLDQTGKTEDQKKAELAADLDSWVKASKNAPEVMTTVAEAYDLRLKNKEKRDFYENQILAKYRNTKYDEAVLYNRIPRTYDKYLKGFDAGKMVEVMLKNEAERTPEEAKEFAAYNQKRQEFEKEQNFLRRAFIKRPKHFDEAKLGNVYFDLLKQSGATKDATDEQLTELIAGVLRYKKGNSLIVNSEIAGLLIKGDELRPDSKLNIDAEKYARAGIVEAENKSKLLAPNEPFTSPELLRGQSLNTLGEVLTKRGKLDEAEQMLLKAEQIKSSESGQENIRLAGMSRMTSYNLAELYVAKKDYDSAEEYYLKNASDNDSARKTFAKFYEKRNGGKKDGFDEYYAGIKQKIKIKERERVMASRIKNAKDAVPFSLKTIDDKTISFSDLKGKIVVINVWGVWCAPCVAEMPQLQQLYKKYESDRDVAVITMDTNDELEKVKKFIADKKYDFPVLLGDSYVSNVMSGGTFVFPTTIFIDKQGKVAFIKQGNTGNVFEEFGWRIEALR